MNYHVLELTVEYKVIKQEVCERLDKQIEKLANEQGLSLIRGGFNFLTQTRDLKFTAEAIEKTLTPHTGE